MRVDPLIEALSALNDAQRKIQTAISAINHAIIAQGEREPCCATHDVVFPPQAQFCADVASDEP